MNFRNLLSPVFFFLLLLYPLYAIYQLEQGVNGGATKILENDLRNYQISIWLCWIVFVSAAIYFKWTTEKNNFFYFVYIYLIIGFSIFGYYFYNFVTHLNIDTGFRDAYTVGVITALQNLIAAAVLTGILQAGVWWFTRRWHRR